MAATVHRTAKTMTDKATGKRIPKLDAKGHTVYHPKWRGKLFLADGRNTTVTLTRNQKESQRLLDKMQEEQDNIRLGVIPIPDKFNKSLQRPIEELFAEYIAWGEAQGGRGKNPWSPGNRRMRRHYLRYWTKKLGLKTVADLNRGIVPAVEKTMRELLADGCSGKTMNQYRDGLCAPVTWAKKRGYLTENPIEATEQVNQAPTVTRRYEPPEVWERIMNCCEPYLRMVLEAALGTGFRVNELRSLTPEHLHPDVNKIWLSADVDKARKERMQPVTQELMDKLVAYGESGEAKAQYRLHPVGGADRRPVPDNPLLFVPSHLARAFNRALEVSGIPKSTKDGKLDVHSTRTAYVNNINRSGADLKTIMTLTRHMDPKVTMTNYARDSEKLLRDTVTQVFAKPRSSGLPISVQQPEKMGLKKTASPDYIKGCGDLNMVGETA